jgi:hypothetical protein
MNEPRKNLPIGYWLKRADELLTKRTDDAQRATGLTRLGWQLMNLVRDEHPARRDDLVNTLRPFADAAAVDAAVSELTARNLIAGSPSTGYGLTSAGAELYEQALAAQILVRQEAMAGISDTEYAATVGVLQRLVENLTRTGDA